MSAAKHTQIEYAAECVLNRMDCYGESIEAACEAVCPDFPEASPAEVMACLRGQDIAKATGQQPDPTR